MWPWVASIGTFFSESYHTVVKSVTNSYHNVESYVNNKYNTVKTYVTDKYHIAYKTIKPGLDNALHRWKIVVQNGVASTAGLTEILPFSEAIGGPIGIMIAGGAMAWACHKTGYKWSDIISKLPIKEIGNWTNFLSHFSSKNNDSIALAYLSRITNITKISKK